MVLTPARALVLALAALGCGLPAAAAGQTAAPGFAEEIERLSEPGGFFDTDNLISNERTYLHALDTLRELGLDGGVYVGVGPDQNFSYIAQLRPVRAYIVDIRRDNLLLHLLLKALFNLSATRIEYLAHLFGRPPPASPAGWAAADVERLAAYIDRTPAREQQVRATHAAARRELARYGVPLSAADHDTIARFHRTFVRRGLSLRFHSLGRPPRPHYPTYRDLLLGADRAGAPSSFLAASESYRFVRSLQQRDLVIPVVGDLAGHRALRAIGAAVAARGEQVSAVYTSNVEFYLSRRGRLARFLDNLAHLPRGRGSVVIRSVFGPGARPYPGRAGTWSYSAPVVQTLDDLLGGFASGRYRGYRDLLRPAAGAVTAPTAGRRRPAPPSPR